MSSGHICTAQSALHLGCTLNSLRVYITHCLVIRSSIISYTIFCINSLLFFVPQPSSFVPQNNWPSVCGEMHTGYKILYLLDPHNMKVSVFPVELNLVREILLRSMWCQADMPFPITDGLELIVVLISPMKN